MEIVTSIFIGALGTWLTLLIVTPLAGRIAQFSFPGWKDALWKLAVVALATNAVTAVLEPVNGTLSWIVSAIVFWVLMVKWFDVDFLGAVVIIVISLLVRMFVIGAIIAAIASAAA
jgi:hypothetical protein